MCPCITVSVVACDDPRLEHFTSNQHQNVPSEIIAIAVDSGNRLRTIIAATTSWAFVHALDAGIPAFHPTGDSVLDFPSGTSEYVTEPLRLVFVEVLVEMESVIRLERVVGTRNIPAFGETIVGLRGKRRLIGLHLRVGSTICPGAESRAAVRSVTERQSRRPASRHGGNH